MGSTPGRPREDTTPPDVRDTGVPVVSPPVAGPDAAVSDLDTGISDRDAPVAGHDAALAVHDPSGGPPDPEEAPPAGAVGVADDLERLWTPHRRAYIAGADKPTGPGPDDGCPFCAVPHRDDEDGLLVARGELVYAVLNLYPYNSGHVLVCPYRHLADYDGLDTAETAEFAAFTQTAMRALRRSSAPHGFNIGINQGGVAGAGIAAHLHQHVVPRWGGDANFMPVIGRTRVLPELLRETRAVLADAWLAVG